VFAARPDPAPPGIPPVWALARYEGVVRSVLLAHKERGRTRLAGPLGAALGRVLDVTARPGDVVVIVPSSRAATRTRGYDPLARIARRAVAASRRSGRPLRLCPALALARPVADQADLDAAARIANLAGAMTVRRGFASSLTGRTIVLLDDVVTTGATLAEAARALRRVGGRVRAAAVVAATSRYADSSRARVFGPGRAG
jgi:predicted amidophosphoribosyltransferase